MPELPPSQPHWTRYYARKIKRHPAFRLWKATSGAVKYAAPNALRMATYRWRELPSIVMVGAQKAGTTQLHAHLLEHPRLFAGANKEVSYFSKNAHRSVEWYRSRFPLRRRVAARGGYVLDSSPSYMPNPQAIRAMHALLPEARLIVLLRDPVSRAFSHYQHGKTRSLETRTFAQVVDDELRENAFPPRFGVALATDAKPLTGYIARGYYALQLELILNLYPRGNVLVIDSAELFADTNAICQRVFSFIGVEPREIHASKVYNRGYYKEKIDPILAERLREHYQPYDALLERLLGGRFGWMARQAA
jgi:hypothetical protein